MSAVVTDFICSTIMAIAGLIVVKNISKSEIKLASIRNMVLLLCVITLPIANYNIDYTYLSTILIYMMTIVAYKYILNISMIKAFIADSILMVFMLILDLFIATVISFIVPTDVIRTTWYINIVVNSLMGLNLIAIFSIKYVQDKLANFVEKIEKRKYSNIIVFFIITVISMSGVLYLAFLNCKLDAMFTTNSLVLVILFLLTIILIKERNSYEKLSDEYDGLLNYVKVFEDWIENEQLNRHEYKNQLAVLRCMSKDKKVKEKIDSIISENINIDGEMIGQLKYLPSGGFKGLLYYKIVVARNQKINIEVDVSSEVGKKLKRFNQEELNVVSKLIGIYCDNAIEAAKETRKKIVLIEIYEYNGEVKIVISNTYKRNKEIGKRNQKGYSTKGEGRGNGLYFASKLIAKNKWIEERQDIIDSFYIQRLSIKKK